MEWRFLVFQNRHDWKTAVEPNVQSSTKPAFEIVISIAKANDSGYILAGTDYDNGWLIKTDFKGEPMWTQQYPERSVFYSVAQTLDGGYVAAGQFKNLALSYSNGMGLLVKVDSLGNLVWNATYGGVDSTDAAFSLVLTQDGGYAFSGQLMNSVWLVKFAPEAGNTSPSPTIPEISFADLFVTITIISIFVFSIRKIIKKKDLQRLLMFKENTAVFKEGSTLVNKNSRFLSLNVMLEK